MQKQYDYTLRFAKNCFLNKKKWGPLKRLRKLFNLKIFNN